MSLAVTAHSRARRVLIRVGARARARVRVRAGARGRARARVRARVILSRTFLDWYHEDLEPLR